MTTRIAIFDDSKSIRNSISLLLRSALSLEVVGSFADAEHCIEKVLGCRPDIILMDIHMPGINGVEAIRLLRKECPNIQILVQTVCDEESFILSAVSAGACGYILKNEISFKLIEAIKTLQTGGSLLSPAVARIIVNTIREGTSNSPAISKNYDLTIREKQVLECIVDGLSHKMVAGRLNISYETVRSHVKKIYEKLDVCSLTEAVAKAIHQKLV